MAVLPAASVDAADAAALAAPAEAPTPRTRSRRRQPAASPAAEPGIEPRAPQPDAGPFAAPPAPDDDWAAAPATDEELAAIARAASGPTNLDAPVWPEDEDELITWSPADAQVADDAFVEAEPEASEGDAAEAIPARRRRRRGGRGRRGRGGQGVTAGGAEPNEPAVMETAVVAESPTESPPAARPARAPRTRQPSLPAYPVEFEPLPPPTKRKPARRPGDVAEPRFSRAEIAEFEQFVRGAPTETNGAAGATDSEIAATPLTPAEQEALRSATKAPPRRTRGTRGRASQSAESAATSGLQETPAFASLPAAPEIATGASGLETLLARQNLLLYTLMERQVALLRNIERSLIALDRRLATGAASATHERAGVFVDVPNVIYAAERFGCQIDFTRLLDFLVHDRGRELVRASAYAPVSDDPSARLELQKFVQPFVNRGYRIVTKPLKRFADGTMKGNFDVELAMDVLTMADRLDVVCLVSGDGDFRRLVELVASKGVRVEAIAFAQSTSSELKAACDEYIDLGLHLRQICGKVG
ncbi:MAG TPA: NYN domain-containing protein [Dehalococcoidia bacterium]|nr:NYN domain-containing protein [Dehalococcoidia bacterium]